MSATLPAVMAVRPRIRSTYTYVVLEISPAAYEEIRGKLAAAGYEHTFVRERGAPEVIDMHGIALQADPALPVLTVSREVLEETRVDFAGLVRGACTQADGDPADDHGAGGEG